MALDVLRAAQREGSLPVLSAHIATLAGNAAEAPELPAALARAVALTEAALNDPALARQAASALYHLLTASAMLWEARQLNMPARAELARLVLRHRVLPRDPLAPADTPSPELLAMALAA